jgi:hypothetical protein
VESVERWRDDLEPGPRRRPRCCDDPAAARRRKVSCTMTPPCVRRPRSPGVDRTTLPPRQRHDALLSRWQDSAAGRAAQGPGDGTVRDGDHVRPPSGARWEGKRATERRGLAGSGPWSDVGVLVATVMCGAAGGRRLRHPPAARPHRRNRRRGPLPSPRRLRSSPVRPVVRLRVLAIPGAPRQSHAAGATGVKGTAGQSPRTEKPSARAALPCCRSWVAKTSSGLPRSRSCIAVTRWTASSALTGTGNA